VSGVIAASLSMAVALALRRRTLRVPPVGEEAVAARP
jgi:hypothetical protein